MEARLYRKDDKIYCRAGDTSACDKCFQPVSTATSFQVVITRVAGRRAFYRLPCAVARCKSGGGSAEFAVLNVAKREPTGRVQYRRDPA